MPLEELVDRLATNVALLTGAVATLAESVNGTYAGKQIYAESAAQNTDAKLPAPAAASTPAPRGRGRPPKGEATTAATAPVVAAVGASTEADPFDAKPAPAAAPTATIDDVRKALTGLKNATSQENALKVLRDAGGADNLPSLKPEKYGVVVEAVSKALTVLAPAKPAVDADDPFGENQAAPAAQEKVPSLEEIKALVVETQKRTSAATVQSVVMKHGGKSPKADGTGDGPSLKALPVSAYQAVVAELKALPTTK